MYGKDVSRGFKHWKKQIGQKEACRGRRVLDGRVIFGSLNILSGYGEMVDLATLIARLHPVRPAGVGE